MQKHKILYKLLKTSVHSKYILLFCSVRQYC